MAAGQGEAANTNPLSASSVMSSLSRSFFGSQGARQQKQQQEEEEEEEEEEEGGGGLADAQTSTSTAASTNGAAEAAAAVAAVAVGVSHTLEWHVKTYSVPWKKQTKDILSDVGKHLRTYS